MDDTEILKDFLAYVLRRIEADRDDLLEEFFLGNNYGRERRATLARLLAEIGE